MMIKICFLLIICQTGSTTDPQVVVNKSIDAHGLTFSANKLISFDFRGKHYSMRLKENNSIYTRCFQDTLRSIEDTLINSTEFTRHLDGNKLKLTKKEYDRFANSLNSILYFLQLPLRLNDEAVNLKYHKKVKIKGVNYHQIEVTFSKEGGGKDFEDVFLYWFRTDNYLLDYLAYKYHTDGGGIRFRQAFNRERVEEIIFQDYINYRPKSIHSNLIDLPKLFEAGKLMELSRIENKNIVISSK